MDNHKEILAMLTCEIPLSLVFTVMFTPVGVVPLHTKPLSLCFLDRANIPDSTGHRVIRESLAYIEFLRHRIVVVFLNVNINIVAVTYMAAL
jgi:hypothetical protein